MMKRKIDLYLQAWKRDSYTFPYFCAFLLKRWLNEKA